jgi:hypothetical protein
MHYKVYGVNCGAFDQVQKKLQIIHELLEDMKKQLLRSQVQEDKKNVES